MENTKVARKEIAKGLKKLRIDSEMTIEKLSIKSGIATSTISGYETGKRSINLDTLERLVNSCGSDLYIFFTNVFAYKQE
jgi:transcriptional regulator with XRE-family HTH domain